MKTLLLATMVLTTSLAFGGEISKEELKDLIQKNKPNLEFIEVGMSAEYQTNYKVMNQYGYYETCLQHEKRVVLSNELNGKYLMYFRNTALHDCVNKKKGTVSEMAAWAPLILQENFDSNEFMEISINKIVQNGNIIEIDGTNTYRWNQKSSPFYTMFDLSKSDFFNVLRSKDGEYTSLLLKRGYTNPETIDLSNVEVTEFEARTL